MAKEKTELLKRIESGESILIGEVSPPKGSDPAPLREAAKRFAGKVHALGVSDNRRGVCMSAIAAASILAAEGLEAIAHVVTRDRNRLALVSDCLGAEALGVRNFLCTTGTHQTLGRCGSAKNVFDIDSVHLLGVLSSLGSDGSVVGEENFEGAGPLCLGGVAAPFADPAEMHLMRLDKKCRAGAQFLITQPVFDIERFEKWWNLASEQGIQDKVALIAGIRVLTSAEEAKRCSEQRPSPLLPEKTIEHLASKGENGAQRDEGVAIAVETIKRLSALSGLRGFEVRSDGDDLATLEVIEKAGLGI